MRCSKARKLIEKYVDSELDDVLVHELRDHLSLCAACAGEESRARSMLGVLDQWSAVEPDLGFETLLSRVQHSNEQVHGQAARSFGVPSWAAAALATVSIGAGVIAGMSAQQDIPAARPTEEQVATAIGLKSFDDMLGASLVYGIEDAANGEEGESL